MVTNGAMEFSRPSNRVIYRGGGRGGGHSTHRFLLNTVHVVRTRMCVCACVRVCACVYLNYCPRHEYGRKGLLVLAHGPS